MKLELTKRKPNRLQGYDYSKNSDYFITMCIINRYGLLWADVGARIARPQEITLLSDIGKVIDTAINNIETHYIDVKIPKYVIMPNHIHMIISLSGNDGRTKRAPTI